MKKIYNYILLSVLLVCLCLLISCFPPLDKNKEGIVVRFPTRQIYTRVGEDYFAQVYLLIDKELFPIGDNTDYVEQELNTDPENEQMSILVEHIPAGRYILWLGIGTKRAENGAFNVQHYYESEEFDLVAGSTTTLTATLLPCPFNKALNVLGENINGAVIDTGGTLPQHLYASGPDTLYSDDGNYTEADPDFNVTEVFDAGDFPAYDINTISKGLDYNGGAPIDTLYLSTSIGISLWNGGTNRVTDFDDDFSTATDLGELNILKSLAYQDGNNVSVFFQRNGGLGGVSWESAVASNWVNVDYSRILKDQLVWDFFVTDNIGSYNGGFFATAFGALKVPQSIIDSYTQGSEVRLMSRVRFFQVTKTVNGETVEIPIVSLGYDTSDNNVYMGTFEGLYQALIGTTSVLNPLDSTPQLIEETRGTRIYIVLINDTYRAYASLTYLFLQEKGGDVIPLPFVAGMPGEIRTMEWDGNTLVISGTLGLVALDVATLFP